MVCLICFKFTLIKINSLLIDKYFYKSFDLIMSSINYVNVYKWIFDNVNFIYVYVCLNKIYELEIKNKGFKIFKLKYTFININISIK